MKLAGVAAALAGAIAIQTTFGRVMPMGGPGDLVLVVVIVAALTMGPAAGLLTGTVGGIAQDTLSGGIIGLSGLAKSTVGFVAGTMGRQFIVTQPFTRFVVFFGGSIAHMGCLVGIGRLVNEPLAVGWSATLAQALTNAIVGVLAFEVGKWAPAAWRRRADRRVGISRRL